MADAPAAAAPAGRGNGTNNTTTNNNNTDQPAVSANSPRKAIKVTILVILFMFLIFLASFNASMRHLIEAQKKEWVTTLKYMIMNVTMLVVIERGDCIDLWLLLFVDWYSIIKLLSWIEHISEKRDKIDEQRCAVHTAVVISNAHYEIHPDNDW